MTFTDVTRINCTPREYFEIDAVSNSDLGRLADTPQKYLDGKIEETTYMGLGSALDSYILTPAAFFEDYATVPVDIEVPKTDLATKFYRLLSEGTSEKEAARMAGYMRAPKKGVYDRLLEFQAANDGRIMLSWADAANIERMEFNLMKNALAKQILAEAEKQVIFIATHVDTGLLCKCMIDLLWGDREVDLKSTSAVNGRDFKRGYFFKFGYDRQAAWYGAISGKESAIMPVSTVSNWCQVAKLDDYIEEGLGKAERLLEALAWHKTNNRWTHSYEYEMNGGWERL